MTGILPSPRLYYIADEDATCRAIALVRREGRSIQQFRAFCLAVFLAPLVPAGATATDGVAAAKSVFYCTGTLSSRVGHGPTAIDRKAATSVVLELEAGRMVLIGAEATAALRFLRVEPSPPLTVYHFGGIAGDLVYKGTFSIPDFRLRVLGAGEDLTIEIVMNCDGSEPLRLY